MAGANYMGGRRNYAKARSKDTTAKAQRNHFGKQKILATSLSKPATLTANRCDLSSNPIARISLAHAQQDPSVRHAQKTHLRSAAFSVYSPPITPPQSKSNMFHDKSHFSGYSTYPLYAFPEDPKPPKRSSVILRDLDLSEPISLRAEMDRMRVIPDLAGLSRNYVTNPSKRRRTEPPKLKEYALQSPAAPFEDRRRSPVSNENSGPSDTFSPKGDYSPSWGTPSTSSRLAFSRTTSDFEPMPFDGDRDDYSFPDSGYAEVFSPVNADKNSTINNSDGQFSSSPNARSSSNAETNAGRASGPSDTSLNWSLERVSPTSLSPHASSNSGAMDENPQHGSPNSPSGTTLASPDFTLSPQIPALFASASSEQPSDRFVASIGLRGSGTRPPSHASSVSDAHTEESLWDISQGQLFDSNADTWESVKSRIVPTHTHVTSRSMLPSFHDISLLKFVTGRRGVGYIDQPSFCPAIGTSDARSIGLEIEVPNLAWETNSDDEENALDYNATYSTHDGSQPQQPFTTNFPARLNNRAITPSATGTIGNAGDPLPILDVRTSFPSRINLPPTSPFTQPSSLRNLLPDIGITSLAHSSFDFPPCSPSSPHLDMFDLPMLHKQLYAAQASLNLVDPFRGSFPPFSAPISSPPNTLPVITSGTSHAGKAPDSLRSHSPSAVLLNQTPQKSTLGRANTEVVHSRVIAGPCLFAGPDDVLDAEDE